VLRLEHGVTACAGRWCAPASSDDDAVLRRARAPVLDVGCGPGRHVLALAERGTLAMGIDLTPHAVALARRRGAPVLERSVFARVPGAGRWRTALLLDGNLGIGADPVALLRRIATLLAPEGRVLVELDAAGSHAVHTTARLELDGVVGPWFPWGHVAVHDVAPVAAASGMAVCDQWSSGTRAFAELRVTRRDPDGS
jgi:SAM-dependent methyltransferase